MQQGTSIGQSGKDNREGGALHRLQFVTLFLSEARVPYRDSVLDSGSHKDSVDTQEVLDMDPGTLQKNQKEGLTLGLGSKVFYVLVPLSRALDGETEKPDTVHNLGNHLSV